MSEQRFPGVESKIVMLKDPNRPDATYGSWYVLAWATFQPELEVLIRGRSRKIQEIAEDAVAALVTNDVNRFDLYLDFIKTR